MPLSETTYALAGVNNAGDTFGNRTSVTAEQRFYFASQSLGTVVGGKTTPYFRFEIDIPANSTITRAKFTLVPTAGDSNQVTARLGLVARDGQWDTSSTRKERDDVAVRFELHDTVGLNEEGASVSDTGYFFAFGTISPNKATGQTVRTTRAGTLDKLVLWVSQLFQAGEPLYAEIWSVDADLRPVARLAQSERVLSSVLPVITPAAIDFDFVGSQRIALADATDYLMKLVLESGNPFLIQIGIDINFTPATGKKFHTFGDVLEGFTNCTYQSGVDLPHPTADGSNAIIAGTVFEDTLSADFNFPTLVSGTPVVLGSAAYGPDVTVPELATLIESYIAAEGYSGPLAIVLDPDMANSGLSSFGSQNGGTAATLTIEYEVAGAVDAVVGQQPAVAAVTGQQPIVAAVIGQQPTVAAVIGTGRGRA